jgi:hypothetical protein
MKRSSMVVADWDTLPAAPVTNACEPLVEIVPPPSVISPAPAMTPQTHIRRNATEVEWFDRLPAEGGY